MSDYAISLKGIATGDLGRFIFRFWEVVDRAGKWEYLQEPPIERAQFTSRSGLILWENGAGALHSVVAERLGEGGVGAWLRGAAAWGRSGVAVAQMRSLPVTLYSGDLFDESTGAVIPNSPEHLAAIWAFVSSETYTREVRKIDRSLKVPTLTLLKVPFDLASWQKVAAEKYPKGLPEPYSDDPTQWLFHGHLRYAEAGTELHVALARLAGYRWPAESDAEMRLSAEARARIAEAAALPESDADGLLAARSRTRETTAGRPAAHLLRRRLRGRLAAGQRGQADRRRLRALQRPAVAAADLRSLAARARSRGSTPSCSTTDRSCGGSPTAAPTVLPWSRITTASDAPTSNASPIRC